MASKKVGAAESMCSRSESKWKTSDDYAVRSMAQTRAVSKALRLPLGFIMELAGYSATPAEEIPTEQPRQRSMSQQARGGADTPPSAAVPYRRSELVALMAEKSMDLTGVEQYADLLGIPKDERPMSDASMDRLIEAVTGHGTDALLDLDADLPELVLA